MLPWQTEQLFCWTVVALTTCCLGNCNRTPSNQDLDGCDSYWVLTTSCQCGRCCWNFHASLSEIEDAISQAENVASSSTETDTAADAIASSLKLDVKPSASEESIIFYISGALARSTVSATRCDHCRDALIQSSVLPAVHVDEELDSQSSQCLDSINRGSLVKPTDFAFNLAVHCWRVFEEIWNTPDLKAKFLQTYGQRLLSSTVRHLTRYIHLVLGSNLCTAGHDLQSHLVRRFFNRVAKNFVKQITTTANQQSGNDTKKRKIAKLASVAKWRWTRCLVDAITANTRTVKYYTTVYEIH